MNNPIIFKNDSNNKIISKGTDYTAAFISQAKNNINRVLGNKNTRTTIKRRILEVSAMGAKTPAIKEMYNNALAELNGIN
jgi:hypothetical protein